VGRKDKKSPPGWRLCGWGVIGGWIVAHAPGMVTTGHMVLQGSIENVKLPNLDKLLVIKKIRLA
jgi:hypothetical protein